MAHPARPDLLAIVQKVIAITGHKRWLITGDAAFLATPDGAAFWDRYAPKAPARRVDLVPLDPGRRVIAAEDVAGCMESDSLYTAHLATWSAQKRASRWRDRLIPRPSSGEPGAGTAFHFCHPLDVALFAMIRQDPSDIYWQAACRAHWKETPLDLRVSDDRIVMAYNSAPDWRRCLRAPEIVWKMFFRDVGQAAQALRGESTHAEDLNGAEDSLHCSLT